MKSVLNIEVSRFKSVTDTKTQANVNLLDWLTSKSHASKVEEVRAATNEAERKRLKIELPAITPSGIFQPTRNKENLVSHTGLIAFDLDPITENLEIPNWENLKEELCKIKNVAYLGRSASGRGYWGLIPIPAEPENHRFYFEALESLFKEFGLTIDPLPKSPASLRFYSYDPDAYFNHAAELFREMKPRATPDKIKALALPESPQKEPWLGTWIIRKLEAAQPGERYNARLKYGRLAGGYVAGGLLDESILDQMIESYEYQYDFEDDEGVQKTQIKAIRDGFRNGQKEPITEINQSHKNDFENETMH